MAKKNYSTKEKAEAIRMFRQSGKTVGDFANISGISLTSIRRWNTQFPEETDVMPEAECDCNVTIKKLRDIIDVQVNVITKNELDLSKVSNLLKDARSDNRNVHITNQVLRKDIEVMEKAIVDLTMRNIRLKMRLEQD